MSSVARRERACAACGDLASALARDDLVVEFDETLAVSDQLGGLLRWPLRPAEHALIVEFAEQCFAFAHQVEVVHPGRVWLTCRSLCLVLLALRRHACPSALTFLVGHRRAPLSGETGQLVDAAPRRIGLTDMLQMTCGDQFSDSPIRSQPADPTEDPPLTILLGEFVGAGKHGPLRVSQRLDGWSTCAPALKHLAAA